MGICLIINGVCATHHNVLNVEVVYEVPCRVQQSQDVDVSRCIETLSIVEYSFVVSTDPEHGNGGEGASCHCVDRRNDVAAVESPLFVIFPSVDRGILHADHVQCLMHQNEVYNRN